MANKPSKLEDELRKASNVKPRPGEDRQKFLARLLSGVQALSSTDWDDLGEEAQNWSNDATRAHDRGKDIPEPSPTDDGEGGGEASPRRTRRGGAEAEGEEQTTTRRSRRADAEGEGEQQERSGMATKAKAKKAPAKAAANKRGDGERPAAKTAAAKPKSASMRRTLKQIVVRKPNIELDELMSRLKDKGFKLSKTTVGSIRADVRDTLNVAEDAGLLKR